jgi:hypothetical protein
MTVIDLSSNRVEGGFFLLNSHPANPFVWSQDAGTDEHFVGAYRDSGAPIRDAQLDMIRSARQKVFIVSFMLGDEELIQELLSAANRLRGGVYVITALDEHSLRRGLGEYDEIEREAPEERRKDFERLTSCGVNVRGHESCHAKFAVVDDRIAIAGSANFVANGFEWTGETNIILRDAAQVRQLARLFTELWYEGCVWEVPPGGTYLVAERAPQQAPNRPTEPTGRPGEIIWTNGAENTSLLRAICETIDAAERELLLSTYSVVGMRAKPHLLLDAIHLALKRGISVRLFIRQRNAWLEQIDELCELHDAGVAIHGDLRNHAKVAIADRQLGVLFSANFDGDHGLDSGVEVGYRLSQANSLSELNRYMEHAISNADARFVRNPTLTELDGQLAARWCKRWNSEPRLLVHCSRSSIESLTAESCTGPCLFEEYEDHRFCVFVGSIKIEGQRQPNVISGEANCAGDGLTAVQRMRDWLTSARRGNQSSAIRKGFFAGQLQLAT